MSKVDHYLAELSKQTDWLPYLLSESGLPEPRGNIELARAVAIAGTQALFEELLTFDVSKAPVNSPEEFLAFCGTLGWGRLVAETKLDGVARLRALSSDPRWRTREAVAMALQNIGRVDPDRLFTIARDWITGNPLERRAAVAGVCEPTLLKSENRAVAALDLLEAATDSVAHESDRKAPEFRALRKALGYCWSVAIAASPEAGFSRFDLLVEIEDQDVRWIVKENLKKNRLRRAEPDHVEALVAKMV